MRTIALLVLILAIMAPLGYASWHTPRVEAGTSPAGNDTNIQFNDVGALAGSDVLRFDKSVNVVTITDTNGFMEIYSTNLHITDENGKDAIDIDGSDNAHNIKLMNAAGVVTVELSGLDSTLTLLPLATPPIVCSGAVEGTVYSDTSHAYCWCDGTTWTKLAGAGTCA